MLQVILTPAARDDLASILAFIWRESPAAAEKLREEMLAAIGSLSEFPRRYPVADESRAWSVELRSIVVFRYRVLYSVQAQRVVVVRVVHGHMRPPEPPR